MTEPKHENWPQIIADIVAAGVSIHKISLMCHRQYNTVKHWALGGEPRHYEGQMLLMIHAEYVKPTTYPSKEVAVSR